MDFDELSSRYDDWFKTPVGRYVEEWEKRLTWRFAVPKAGERVLDVGTGTAQYLLDLVGLGAQGTGIDVSLPMIRVARDKARARGLRIAMVRATGEELPFRERSFDLVLSVTAFEFFTNPEKAVSEMRRVCRPGGRIVVGVLNRWSIWALRRRVIDRFKETIFRRCRFYSFREMRRLFGPVEWSTCVFAPPGCPSFLLPFFHRLEPLCQRWLRPFGAYLVIRCNRP